MPRRGYFSLAQPAIRPIYSTRQFQSSLLHWSGQTQTYAELVKDTWKTMVFGLQNISLLFEDFWISSLQSGVYEHDALAAEQPPATFEVMLAPKAPRHDGYELIVYESSIMGIGHMANNPWLLELPDPILKIAWDNALLAGPSTAQELALGNGDLLEIGGETYPVIVQPGMPDKVFALSSGYGRQKAGKAGNTVGKNAFVFLSVQNGFAITHKLLKDFRKTGETHDFAFSQRHSSMEGRSIVRESTLAAYKKNAHAGNEEREALKERLVSLYPAVEFPGHHWGLAVDLNACVGCSNCVISCQAENNIPTVGKELVKATRIMHWIRVDRYFSGTPEKPEVVFQPLMCQQCDNAPCENVCPVSATMHSDEGISQMAYNRCVGTRYCINNCPYKQRRFNWYQFSLNKKFDYHMNSDLGRLVLNPDVTVRERGVVEKCSFCVQRIQEKKLQAKLEGRQLRDGEIQPACVQSCPAKALVFGDMNDAESKVSKMIANERNYHLLEELHTLPSVGYLTRIRNRKEGEASV
jgi:molybdopterin-containing oxidoreductase family iron-sulfur binding subunit